MKRIVPCSTRTLIWSFVLRDLHVPLWPDETWPVFIFRAMLLRREHFDARSTRASDDMAAVQYFGNGTDAFAHPRRAGFARNPPATPFDGNPTRFVFVFVTARPHLTTSPRPVPTRSCQGVRGHGGRYRLGPRPRRRGRLEGTPRDLRNPSPDAQSLARGTPQPHPLRRKNIRNTPEERVSPLTFEPSSSRLTRLPAPPPAELALADQARGGGVLRQGQVSGLEGAFCAVRKRQSVVGSVSRREDVVGNET